MNLLTKVLVYVSAITALLALGTIAYANGDSIWNIIIGGGLGQLYAFIQQPIRYPLAIILFLVTMGITLYATFKKATSIQ